MRRRGIVAAAAVVTALAIFAVLSLAGGEGASALAEAGERIEGQSMRMKLKMSMPLPDEGVEMDVDAEGVAAADGATAELTATYNFAEFDQPVPADIRMIGDEMWMHSDMFEPLLPRGKDWVHMVDTSSAPQTLTPAEFTRFLTTADDVDELDDDARVAGKPATYYRGIVDVKDLADEIGGETERWYERLGRGSDLALPIEAWIGRDGLPVRIRVAVERGLQRLDFTVDVLEYGVPVDVEPPPASRTIEEAEFDRLTATG